MCPMMSTSVYVSPAPGVMYTQPKSTIAHATWKVADASVSTLFMYLRGLHLERLLSDNLHVQVDGGECTVPLLCMLALILSLGWVKRVSIRSLIVGHTHIDVDQCIGRSARSRHLARAQMQTWSALLALYERVYAQSEKHPIPVEELAHIWNFGDALRGCANPGAIKGLKGRKGQAQADKPHRLELELGTCNEVLLSVFASTDTSCTSEGNVIKKKVPFWSKTPQLSDFKEYDLTIGLAAAKKMLMAAIDKQTDCAVLGLTPEQVEEWREFELPATSALEDLFLLSDHRFPEFPLAAAVAERAVFVRDAGSSSEEVDDARSSSEEGNDDEDFDSGVDRDLYVVEEIVDDRIGGLGGGLEYLVRWEGYDATWDTWEPESSISSYDALLSVYRQRKRAAQRLAQQQAEAQIDAQRGLLAASEASAKEVRHEKRKKRQSRK